MEKKTVDYVAPGTRQLIAFLTPSDYKKGYVIGYKVESELVDTNLIDNYPKITYFYTGIHAIRN